MLDSSAKKWSVVDGWMDGWVGGWVGGSKSRVKDCLQQSKIMWGKLIVCLYYLVEIEILKKLKFNLRFQGKIKIFIFFYKIDPH